MNIDCIDHFISVNKIKIHVIEYPATNKPTLLFLHGLTANAHVIEGLIQAGLHHYFHIVSIDFRGRGLSDKVAFQYSIQTHAEDVIGVLRALQINRVILVGHSFGGLMSSYLAYHFPEYVSQVIILDAAPEMNPKTAEMLAPALSRIDHRYPSFEHYIEEVKKAPYMISWDDAMIRYYQADVATAEDGSVEPISNFTDIAQIAQHVSKENWTWYFTKMKQPCLLVVALDNYTLNMPLLPTHKATKIVEQMQHVTYKEVDGNHQTMLFGSSAVKLVKFIVEFTTAHLTQSA